MTRVLNRWSIILALVAGLLAGCSLTQPQPQGEAIPPSLAGGPPPVAADQDRAYQEAVNALQAGRAAEAQARFARLATVADNPALARQARYGQAAAALAGARNAGEARQALELWRAWRETAPARLDREDPRLLAPLVEGLGACLAAQGGAAGREETERLNQRVKRLQDENALLKRQLAELEELQRELSQRKNRLNR